MFKVNCPVCISGNYFDFSRDEIDPCCEDCGFPLLLHNELRGSKLEKCCFCGNDRFYYERSLLSPFVAGEIVCYLCEAKLKGVELIKLDSSFDAETEQIVHRSENAVNWQERVESYSED